MLVVVETDVGVEEGGRVGGGRSFSPGLLLGGIFWEDGGE